MISYHESNRQTALKTLSLYLRAAKVEAEEANIETDGMAHSVSKLRQSILALTNNKVDIMLDSTTLKSTYQIYDELADVWSDMADIDRASLLEILGGKRNSNIVASLLTNWETAEAALQSATNSAGSASRENEKQMESLQGKMRLVQASFEDFSNTLLNSKIFKVALSGVSGVLNGLTSLMKTLGTLPVALGVATAAWKGYQKAKELATEYKGGKGFDIRTKIQNIRDTIKGFSSRDSLSNNVLTYTKGGGMDLNMANAGVREFTDSVEKMFLKIEAPFAKVGESFNKVYEGVKNLKAGNDTLNSLSRNIQKYKDASIAAMGSGDDKGAMKNNQLMNAYRNQLAKLYREMQASNPEAAAGMRDAYQQAMMGYGTELPQKSIPLWKKMSVEIAKTKAQVVGMNAAEKAAVVTTNVLGVSFKALKAGAVALGTALKSALSAFAIGMVIQGIVTLVDKFVNRYKNAAEEARNTAEASREVSKENSEVSKTVDDIVERYKEYGKASSLSASENAENRANLLSLQKEITASVGDEVGQVDLVNGGYEQQLVLLEEIKKKRNEINQTSDATTIGNDIASSRADYQANKSKNFSPIKFDTKDKSAQRTEGILRNSQYAEYFGFLGNVVRPIIEGGDIDSTIDQFRIIMKVLEELQEKSVPPDDTIFSALAAEANKLKADLGPAFEDAQIALNNVITGEALSDPFDAGAESLEKYKTELGNTVRSAANVKAALNEGLLTQEDINAAIEEFIQQNFPDEYAKQIRPLKEIEQITKSLFGSGKKSEGPNFLADFSMQQLQDQVEAAFGHGEELEIAYSLILDKKKSFGSIEELRKAVQEQMDYFSSSDYVADSLRDTLRNIIDDDQNKTAINSLKKLAESTGIKASDIEDLAEKGDAFATVLDRDGVSAEFLARILQREFTSGNTGAGIDSITNKSLDLNKALNGMEKALDSASAAKKRYDSEMSKGNSDEGFKNASEAFNKMYEAARTGNVGSGSTDFWAGANYLLGEDQLKSMGYDAQAVIDKLKQIAPLFSSAESAGLGLVQKFKKMADESGNIIVNGEKLATVMTGENGGVAIDVDPANFDKIAQALGISKDAFTEALYAAEKWAQVTTFSSNDVYNELRNVGDVLDNTSGKFKDFASSEIIDTKNIGLSTQELEKFKQELNSTGNSYVFLELQGSAEDALKSLKDLDVATEKLNKDGSGTGKWDIDTSSLNSLLAALEYSEAEVKNLYDRLKDVSGMSDDEIADVMKDFTEKAKSGKGEVKGIREQLDAIKNKRVELEIEIKAKGANLDPTGKGALMPDTDALAEFMNNPVLNPGEFNDTMQAGIDMIENGIDKAIDSVKSKSDTLKKALDIRDAAEYSEEYRDSFIEQMDLAHQGAEALRAQGLTDADQEVQEMKQRWYDALQGMLDYDKEYYNRRKSILEDHISELKDDPFGDIVSNGDEIISSYQQLYDEVASVRRQALEAGYSENSEYVRQLTNEMKQAVYNIENAKREAFKGQMSASQLNIDILTKDRHDGESADNIVAEYTRMMNAVESEMSRLRSEGVSENNEYLLELKRQWYDYRDAAREAQKQVYQEQADWARHLTQMQEYSIVGSSGKASMIGAYQNEQQALLQEISNLAAMGYRETDQEIYSLREQVAALNNSIRDVQKELAANEANWAKHLSTMAQYTVSRGGDPRTMISYYANEQRALQNQINTMASLGYSATDQEIYSLREQIEALNGSIMDANAQWLNILSQQDKQQEKLLQLSHANSSQMADYYNQMWHNAYDRYEQLFQLGFGEYSSEVQNAYNEYLDYLQKEEDAYKQSMQESIDIYSYYRKQLEVGNYPFEEHVRVIHEEMELVNHMADELRRLGYQENSSEIVSLKTQYLQLIEDIKSKASNAISEIDRKFSHQLKMIDNHYNDQLTVEMSIPVLEDQKEAYHELADQLRDLGFADDTPEVSSLMEKWWEVHQQIIEMYKKQINDMIAVSDHSISMLYDRHNYSFREYEEEYRRMQAAVHATANKYREMGVDETDEMIRELQNKWWEYEDKIAAVYEKLVTDANQSLQSIKGAYDDFFKAAEDYTQYGTLTYDTFKSILDLGPEYMAYLSDSNGLLKLNKETMQQVIAAKAEDLALNTALNYVEQLRIARQNENYDTLNKLALGQAEVAKTTWDYIYAQLKLMDLTDVQYQGALSNINKWRSLTKQFATDIDASLNIGKSNFKSNSLDDLSKSFDDFVKYVEERIKVENEEAKDALDKQLDKYKDIVKEKKKALELAKEEKDYEKDVAEQVKEIAKLQTKIDQLSLDDSKEATAQRKKLTDDLVKAQKKLDEDQSKHAYDAAKDQLDLDQEMMERTTKERKEALEEEVKSAEKIHRLAMEKIMSYGEEGLDKLLDEVLDWNLKAGNSLERNIKDTWKDIIDLVERYGGLVGAIEAVRANQLKETVKTVVYGGETVSSDSGESIVAGVPGFSGTSTTVGRTFYNSTEGIKYKEIIEDMIENSINWWIAEAMADSMQKDLNKESLAKENASLADEFRRSADVDMYRNESGNWILAGAKQQAVYDKQDVGRWVVNKMLDNEAHALTTGDDTYLNENYQLADALSHYTGANIENIDGDWYYNGKRLYDEDLIFHKGGVVGYSNVKQDEVMAKLQKGEMILNKERQKGLFKLVDLASYLSDKLGVNLKHNLSLSGGGIAQDIGIAPTRPTNQINSSVNFAPSINVTITGGAEDPTSARKYAKQIADMTLGNLRDAFAQRGITKSLANA